MASPRPLPFGAAGARTTKRGRERGVAMLCGRCTTVAPARGRKSRLVTRAGRRRVCGVVVNERTNVARHEYDRLGAILHNAAVRGPGRENRFARIDWNA